MAVDYIFADALRHNWPKGLNGIGKPKFENVESWLISGAYIWLASPSGRATISIRGAENDWANGLASEISRFSCAAYESLLDSAPPKAAQRSLGWSLVRHYYATFYSIHAILRIAGKSLNYFPSPMVKRLNQLGGQYLGASPQLNSGLHLLEIDPINSTRLNITPIGGNGGGSHEEMWKLFLKLLRDLENQILLSQGQSQVAQDTINLTKNLREILCSQGNNNGAWTSTIRNAINYRHEYGVWYPYNKPNRQSAEVTAHLSQWSRFFDPSIEFGRNKDHLVDFVDVSTIVTQLMTGALLDISKRSTVNGKCFVDLYPFKLLKQRQIQLKISKA